MNKLIPLKELFIPVYGVNLELVNVEECRKNDYNSIRFISRTEINNGVSAYVKRMVEVPPNPAHTISVAVSGSVLSSFYQDKEYYSGRDLYYLLPNKKMSKEEMIFYALCIKANKYKYNYGRAANKTLKDILLPAEMPNDFKKITFDKISVSSDKGILKKQFDLNIKKWKYFELKSIFRFEKCKCSSAYTLMEEGGDIYYIGAKKDVNGVMQKVKLVENLVSKGNCIVFIGDGQGSIGYTTYHPADFIGSTTLSCGYNNLLNKYNALFMVTVLDLERFKYSFGRKYGKAQLLKTKIKLPAKNGQPDFEFMENYIKSLPYSVSI